MRRRYVEKQSSHPAKLITVKKPHGLGTGEDPAPDGVDKALPAELLW